MRRALAAVLMLAGVLALADAALTLVWQEPVSALAARRAQPRLRAELRALTLATPAPSGAQRRAAAAASARALRARTRDGDAVARLRIPRLGLDAVVVRGTRPDDLEERARAVRRGAPAGRARDRADRRAPHDLRRAVPPHRPPAPRRPDHGGDAVRHVPVRASRARGSSIPPICGRFERSATPASSCPPVIRCFPPLVASWSTLGRSASDNRPELSSEGSMKPDRRTTETGAAGARAHTDERPVHESHAHQLAEGAHRALRLHRRRRRGGGGPSPPSRPRAARSCRASTDPVLVPRERTAPPRGAERDTRRPRHNPPDPGDARDRGRSSSDPTQTHSSKSSPPAAPSSAAGTPS